jgi:hypothetical protein
MVCVGIGTGRHLSMKLDRYLYRTMEIHAFPGKGIKSVFFLIDNKKRRRKTGKMFQDKAEMLN